MKPAQYIRRLANASKSNDKKAILREAALDGCNQLFSGFQMAYDNSNTYGIKKIPLINGDFSPHQLAEDIGEFNWADFVVLQKRLKTRQLTVAEAKDAMREVAKIVCIEDWNLFYRAILLKDMKCGVNAATVNSILTEIGGDALKYLIPIWAIPMTTKTKRQLNGEKLVEAKVGGKRAITIMDVTQKMVYVYSGSGKLTNDYDDVVSGLEDLLESFPVSIVFDGEFKDGTYYIFDMMVLEDFNNGGTSMPLSERHSGLVEIAPYLQDIGNIQIQPKKAINLSTETGLSDLRGFYDEAVNMGYNSIIVKDADSPYKRQKNNGWVEWTPPK